MARMFNVVKTDGRVESIAPYTRTLSRRYAEHRARKLNAKITYPSYRWEVICDWEHSGKRLRRWLVVAKQNKLVWR